MPKKGDPKKDAELAKLFGLSIDELVMQPCNAGGKDMGCFGAESFSADESNAYQVITTDWKSSMEPKDRYNNDKWFITGDISFATPDSSGNYGRGVETISLISTFGEGLTKETAKEDAINRATLYLYHDVIGYKNAESHDFSQKSAESFSALDYELNRNDCCELWVEKLYDGGKIGFGEAGNLLAAIEMDGLKCSQLGSAKCHKNAESFAADGEGWTPLIAPTLDYEWETDDPTAEVTQDERDKIEKDMGDHSLSDWSERGKMVPDSSEVSIDIKRDGKHYMDINGEWEVDWGAESFAAEREECPMGTSCPTCYGQGSPYGCGGDYCGWCGTDWKQPCDAECPAYEIEFGSRWGAESFSAESACECGGFGKKVKLCKSCGVEHGSYKNEKRCANCRYPHFKIITQCGRCDKRLYGAEHNQTRFYRNLGVGAALVAGLVYWFKR